MKRSLFILATAIGVLAAVSVNAGVPATAGPDLLRLPPATAPQLTNGGIWSAPPILVSGATAYRNGEFIYQDFLYDDHGANSGESDPTTSNPNGVATPNGTYTYPSG